MSVVPLYGGHVLLRTGVYAASPRRVDSLSRPELEVALLSLQVAGEEDGYWAGLVRWALGRRGEATG